MKEKSFIISVFMLCLLCISVCCNKDITGISKKKYTEQELMEIEEFNISEFIEKNEQKIDSCFVYKGKEYAYSFKYVKKGKSLVAWDYQGAVYDVKGYNKEKGIIWLETDNLWNSYYLEYSTGELEPIVDTDAYTEMLSKRYYWNDDGESIEGYVKLATDVQVSPDETYLLYRSNRDCLTNANGDYNIDSKGDWFVQNINTGEEVKLSFAPSYLHNEQIGFIDDSVIGVMAVEENDSKSIRYDCLNKTIEYIECPKIYSKGYSLFYETTETDKELEFWDIYNNKSYVISKNNISKSHTIFTYDDLICVLDDTGSWKVYFTELDSLLDFGQAKFTNLEKVEMIYDVGDNEIVILGSNHGEKIGFSLILK